MGTSYDSFFLASIEVDPRCHHGVLDCLVRDPLVVHQFLVRSSKGFSGHVVDKAREGRTTFHVRVQKAGEEELLRVLRAVLDAQQCVVTHVLHDLVKEPGAGMVPRQDPRAKQHTSTLFMSTNLNSGVLYSLLYIERFQLRLGVRGLQKVQRNIVVHCEKGVGAVVHCCQVVQLQLVELLSMRELNQHCFFSTTLWYTSELPVSSTIII